MALVGYGQAWITCGYGLVVRVNGIQAVVQGRQAGAAAGEAQDVARSDRREIQHIASSAGAVIAE